MESLLSGTLSYGQAIPGLVGLVLGAVVGRVAAPLMRVLIFILLSLGILWMAHQPSWQGTVRHMAVWIQSYAVQVWATQEIGRIQTWILGQSLFTIGAIVGVAFGLLR